MSKTLSIVTGGNGFVGQHLVRALLARGDEVRVLDVAPDSAVPGVDYRRVDITDVEAVRRAVEGAEVIFHNASVVHTKQNQKDFVWKVNLGGTQNLMDAAKAHGVTRFVYVSSGSVVYEGRDIENGDERLPYSSISQAPYADSKIAAEKAVLARDGDGIRTTAIRPHVIFGPGDNRFLPAVLEKAESGMLRFSVGRGTWLSDYTYVDNLVDALLLADEKLAGDAIAGGQAYFVTNGEPMPFWSFVEKVLARLGYPPIKYRVPYTLAYGIAAVKEGIDTLRGGTLNAEDGFTRFAIKYMCTHHYFSIEKARRELGYEPKVSVDEGIERTCAMLPRARKTA
ncbi:MAG: NAD-dependent epimerase/dehydratase family protein [Myxococcales bacterium]|nr:NAD-dependent epimerase/dehydratase family protein [Myxococcales bacterium]